MRILDLGAGTGANLRWLADRLPPAGQDWTLVECDRALIAAGSVRLTSAPVVWRYCALDLATDLERLAEQGADLVTASALLDLVSAAWLDRLLALRRRTGAALYLALSYDGRIAWDPADESDRVAAKLVDAHQRTDKGFGPALGPQATAALAAKLDPAEGHLTIATSDWLLGGDDGDLQSALLDGHEAAAVAMAPQRKSDLRAWARRRAALIHKRRSSLRVGHRDILLLPR
jgi:hypothetical protein